ncbi:MAG: hypothetical protein OK454_02115 [Thaumarchaeota archaeon]|nr:hypothetical protein [Nitrososphaerota archaeon]
MGGARQNIGSEQHRREEGGGKTYGSGEAGSKHLDLRIKKNITTTTMKRRWKGSEGRRRNRRERYWLVESEEDGRWKRRGSEEREEKLSRDEIFTEGEE